MPAIRAAMVHRNARRLLRLINQLLELAKLETCKMRLQASPGDIVSFLKSLVMSFESLAHGKGIELRFEASEAPQSTPLNGGIDSATMYFDRDKVEKMFSNLMSNAFKFTPEGGSVNVACTLIADCRLGIADSGAGQYLIRSPQCALIWSLQSRTSLLEL